MTVARDPARDLLVYDVALDGHRFTVVGDQAEGRVRLLSAPSSLRQMTSASM